VTELVRVLICPSSELSHFARADYHLDEDCPFCGGRARKDGNSVSASCVKRVCYQIECEGRLALAVADLRANPALGRPKLETLEKETHERGLELVSHKAELLAAVNQSSPSHP
jgi:hypothetical protein